MHTAARRQPAALYRSNNFFQRFVPHILLLLALLFCLCSRADEVLDCSEGGFLDALFSGEALFTEDCNITITAPISITQPNTVIDAQGHNVSISGDNQFLVFEIQSGASLTISGVTITGGQNTNGGAMFIYDGSGVLLSNCTLTANQAIGTNGLDGANGSNVMLGNGGNGRNATPGGASLGGAIFNLGSLTLINCKVSTNSATGGTGANGGAGGNSTSSLGVGGNGGNGSAGGAAFGAAIYHAGDTLVLSNCIFSGNTVVGGNGGNGGAAGTGTFGPGLVGSGSAGGTASGAAVYSTNAVDISQSTFSDNTAQGGDSANGGTSSSGQGVAGPRGGDSFGGALFVAGGGVTNCTFYNDNTTGGAGGDGGPATASLGTGGNGGNGGSATGAAIYNKSSTNFSLVSCTISNCSAFGGTNGVAGTGPFPGTVGSKGVSHGSIANGGGTFNFMNTILATNRSGGAGFGTIHDSGYNIGFGNTITLNGTGSFKTNNVKLRPLANYGGFTPTMALTNGSPALDKIPPNTNNPALNPFPPIDQRGFPRPIPVNGNADIGAYEFEFVGSPIIIQQPTNTSTALNSNATFFVVASGAPVLLYRWSFNGVPITNAISTLASFTVTNATATNRGPYTVTVSNSFGSVVSTQAFVLFSPSIISQPTSQTVAPGGTATFVVTAIGDGTLLYQWQFEGDDIPDATNASFSVPSAHQADVGNYQVIVTNDFGSITSAPAALNLLPGILAQPTNITAAAGSTVVFSVNAEGSAPLAYQWQKNGTNAIAGATSSAFVIGNVQAGAAGAYNVVITNAFGSVTSDTATLTVSTQGPAIVTQPAQVIVPTNSDATFTVTATGAPPLSYQWRFNNTNLAARTTTALVLHSVQPTNAGNYLVVVTNSFGAVTSSPALLKLMTGPLSLGTPAVVSNGFSLIFSSQTGFTYVIEYKTNLNSPAWTPLLTTNGTGSPVLIQDPTTNSSSRFYRIRAQ
jgi:uncharacterized cupredoxin-like copper-binding protein